MVSFVKATREDAQFFYDLYAQPSVRKNSFRSDVISYESHLKWFNERVAHEDFDFYVVYDDDNPVGIFRIAWENEAGIISYSVDEKFQNKGYGTKMLIIAKNLKCQEWQMCLIGYVKSDNVASIKAFERAGYEKQKKDHETWRFCYETKG